MSHTIVATSFKQELYAAHVLAMQCGERAIRFLDRARAAGAGRGDRRADLEGLRMGTLASRLMENVGRGLTLNQSGRAPNLVGALVGAGLSPARADLRSAPTELQACLQRSVIQWS